MSNLVNFLSENFNLYLATRQDSVLYRTLVLDNLSLSKHIKARSFLVEHIFVFMQLDLAQKAEGYLEIYALDMASMLLISVRLIEFKRCIVPIIVTLETQHNNTKQEKNLRRR